MTPLRILITTTRSLGEKAEEEAPQAQAQREQQERAASKARDTIRRGEEAKHQGAHLSVDGLQYPAMPEHADRKGEAA
jgi:hypothetical protein